MMEVEQHSSLPNRLNSVDSGISEEADQVPSPSWSPCTPQSSGTDFVDSPSFFDSSGEPISSTTVKTISFQLAYDIVRYMTEGNAQPVNKYAKTLRRLSDELSSKHEILFTSLVKKLNLTQDSVDCQFLENVADRMFSDGQYNWGRIVTYFTFAGWLARYCTENHMDPQWPGKIAERTASYVSKNLNSWIVRQGGWDAMEEFFKQPENLEAKIWRGLFYTVLGLGALATTVAVVR